MPSDARLLLRFGATTIIALFMVALPGAAGAVISDGAPAIDLLGQYDDDPDDPQPVYTKSDANNGPNKLGISNTSEIGGLAIDLTNRRLFLGDSLNARVLVYNLTSTGAFVDRIPDYVLGQSNYYTDTTALTQTGLSIVAGLAYDDVNNRLFVADRGNNRVLMYDVSSIANGESAVNVLGQADFTSSSAANTQVGMNGPRGLAYDATNARLFVSQPGNHRVTVYDVSSISDGEDAVNVLGQSDFTSFSAANTQAGMKSPQGLALSGSTALFVAQGGTAFNSGNNRVTVYDVSSITDGENAVSVLGQATFTASTAAITQTGMRAPRDLAYDPVTKRLFVAQGDTSLPNRVTVYNLADGISDGENAVNVLGQATFTSSTAANTQAGMKVPTGLAYDATNQRLFVFQAGSNRITVYDVSSITDGEDAIDLLGQYDDSTSDPQPVYTKSGANNGPSTFGFSVPNGTFSSRVIIDTVDHYLFLSDTSNHRVLVFNLNTNNTLPNRIPDSVLGQSNFYTGTATNTQAGMNSPTGLAYDSENNRLFVAQGSAHRVTVYDVTSITDGENAVNVLGQADFTSTTAANTQTGMNAPQGIAYDSDSERLFVAQSNASQVPSRVTVYDVSSITDGENAVNVLGQADFTSTTAANTQAGMNSPRDLAYDAANSRLFVAQGSAHRVTVYDVTSITDGENAANVLGQADFTSITAANTQAGMNSPTGLAYDSENNRLFVAQGSAHRVTVYDVTSITDGENAVNVLGQADFTSTTAANTQTGMNAPQGIAYDSTNSRLFVAQVGNNRVTVFDVAPADTTSPSVSSLSPADDSTDVAVDANLVLTFDETTRAGTGTLAIQKFSDDSTVETITVSGALLAGNGSTELTLNPSSDLANGTDYYITWTANAFKDASGNHVAAQTSTSYWNFTTVAVAASSPSSSESSVSDAGGGRGGHRGSSGGMAERIASARGLVLARFSGQLQETRTVARAPSAAPTQRHGTAPRDGGAATAAEPSGGSPPAPPPSLQLIAERRGMLLVMADDAPILYRDVETRAWYAPYVADLAANGIAQGYRDAQGNPTGEFGVANPVTRAEVLKMALEAAGKKPLPGSPRNDSARGSWAAGYVKAAEEMRLTVFTPETDIHAPATRGEVVQILLEVLGIPTAIKIDSPFTDVRPAHPFAKAITVGYVYGFIQGDTNADGSPRSRFRPDDSINRAEAAKLIALAREVLR